MKKLHAIVWKEGKWFVAQSLETGVASQGRTEKSALKNLKEAVELYLEDDTSEIVQVEKPKIQALSIQLNA